MKSKVFAVLTMLAAMTSGAVLAQDAPLPQVERQSSPTRISSAECNEPPVPELREPVSTPVLIAEEIREPERPERPALVPEVEPVSLQPTPSEERLSAAQAMALLQRTVRTGPYEDFQRALAVAKQKVAAMPAGNERRAFTEALDVYSDIATVWEHAMTHPIGAFFNDELLSGAFTRLARKYPSYVAYIAQQSVTDSAGNTLYPTIETRMFLADEADRRLRGIRLPLPPPGVIAELPTRPTPEVGREPVRPRPRPQQPVTRPTERPRTTTAKPSTTQPRPRTTPRQAPTVKPPVEKPAVTTRPTPTVKPPVEKPTVTTKPVTVTPTPTSTVSPSTAAPSTGEPIPTATEAPVVGTAVEAAPTTTAPPPEQIPEEGRRALPSQTTLLLVAFGLIALIAIALMIRALRPRQAPSTLIAPSPETPQREAAPGDADWIDPETRHWIEDVNKTDKPPN
jgi:hypothetical protein